MQPAPAANDKRRSPLVNRTCGWTNWMLTACRGFAICLSFTICLGFAVCLSFACAGQAAAANVKQILLLDNEELISGSVECDAEYYFVSTDSGSRLSIPRNQVVSIAANETEIYEFRSRQLPAVDAQGRIQLAAWCLEHRLLDCAKRELQRLPAGGDAAEIARLTARLRFLSQPDPHPHSSAATRPHSGTAQAPRRTPEISETAMAEFASRIQPLLFNTCGAAGCHGRSTTADFRLAFPLRGTHVNQRLTKKNLVATLQQIDFLKPDNSPLTVAPRTAHGTADRAVLGENQQSLHALLESWVLQVANTRQGESESSATAPLAGSLRANAPGMVAGSRSNIQPTAAEHVDPFDPEQFNLHYGGASGPVDRPYA